MNNFFSGVIGSLIASAIWALILRLYLGTSDLPGIKANMRLKHDLRIAGVINFFPDRSFYHAHKDHGSASNYINKSTHSKLLYVGFWLAGSTEMGSIVKTIKELASKRINVSLIFVDPSCNELVSHCSNYFGISQGEFKGRVIHSISKVADAKRALPPQQKQYVTIKLHNAPITASAFLIDYDNRRDCKILLDHKLFGLSRDNSYGIELKDNSKLVCSNVINSYMQIYENAKPYNIDEKRKSEAEGKTETA